VLRVAWTGGSVQRLVKIR